MEESRIYPAGHGWQRISMVAHFQMCVCSSIVAALCVYILQVAVYWTVKNVLGKKWSKVHSCICVVYYFVFMSVGACECVSPAVSNMLALYGLFMTDTWAKHTQHLKAPKFMQKQNVTSYMFPQLPKASSHEIRWSMPQRLKHQILCSWVIIVWLQFHLRACASAGWW